MSFELLKSNIQQEKKLVVILKQLVQKKESYGADDKDINSTIASAKKQIAMLNKSIPLLLSNISPVKKLEVHEYVPEKKLSEQTPIVTIKQEFDSSNAIVAITKKDKNAYLEQLNISESSLKSIKKKKIHLNEFENEFKKSSNYNRISNKIFGNLSKSLISKGYFDRLNKDIKRANFIVLLHSYVSAMFLTTLISFFISLIVFLFLLFFSVSFNPPFIFQITTSLPMRILQTFWIIFAIPVLTFFSVYLYPSTERNSIQGQIDYEMPFVTIQMSAIAGADIEPSQIFRIIALSREYPAIKREAKKLINQINLYGYDLVTAMKNVAASSPSKKWADLLNGISTTIRSGGDLSKYLDKKAETLLFEYRLEREKATRSAETFMDIYISVVITAPMIMMLLFVMMSISNIGFNLPIPILSLIMVGIVAFINVIFLIFLNVKQKRV
ncbi:type II secretion system F family protein [Candidatus Pacearchaeota archaeon]|nr:type II secretion system F family protein [Candidatus Pacearchaeota archaeon]